MSLMSSDHYEKRSRDAALAAIAKGHVDVENLRELLIWTTSKSTEPMVSEYFSHHFDDEPLLSALLKIALEGEDAGDAPLAPLLNLHFDIAIRHPAPPGQRLAAIPLTLCAPQSGRSRDAPPEPFMTTRGPRAARARPHADRHSRRSPRSIRPPVASTRRRRRRWTQPARDPTG